MSGKSVTNLGIGLLIIGILLGVGGGYYYVQSSSTPILSKLEAQKAAIQADVGVVNSSIQGLEEVKFGLEGDVNVLDNQIQSLNGDIAQSQNEITSLKHDIEVSNDKIADLQPKSEHKSGYEQFSAYGLWFQYPSGMSLSLTKMLEHNISDKYGWIKGEISRTSRHETIMYNWQYVDFTPDVRKDLTELVYNFSSLMKTQYNYNSEISEVKTSEISGHTFYYQTITIADKGTTLIRVTYGCWYCNIASVAYRFIYYNTYPNAQDTYTDYIDSTFCR
jgi:hypothetical protein